MQQRGGAAAQQPTGHPAASGRCSPTPSIPTVTCTGMFWALDDIAARCCGCRQGSGAGGRLAGGPGPPLAARGAKLPCWSRGWRRPEDARGRRSAAGSPVNGCGVHRCWSGPCEQGGARALGGSSRGRAEQAFEQPEHPLLPMLTPTPRSSSLAGCAGSRGTLISDNGRPVHRPVHRAVLRAGGQSPAAGGAVQRPCYTRIAHVGTCATRYKPPLRPTTSPLQAAAPARPARPARRSPVVCAAAAGEATTGAANRGPDVWLPLPPPPPLPPAGAEPTAACSAHLLMCPCAAAPPSIDCRRGAHAAAGAAAGHHACRGAAARRQRQRGQG